MNFKKFSIAFMTLMSAHLYAKEVSLFDPESLPKKQYVLSYTLEKNQNVLLSGFMVFASGAPSSQEGGGTGKETNMYYYKCINGNKESKPFSRRVRYDNYPTIECIADDYGKGRCIIKLFNAVEKNALAFEEYEKRSCKEVEPLINVEKITLNIETTNEKKIDYVNNNKIIYRFEEMSIDRKNSDSK